jgi:50S ribosomal protein L16 3-hydroxylase
MLYLPPCLAHWGIAVGSCMTWSVGFRAPSAQELGTQFLAHLQEQISLEGMYADPDLKLQIHPAEISSQMIARVEGMLNNIRWDKADVARFLGEYLTEPKSHIVFTPPRRMAPDKFGERLQREGIRLDLKTQMLISGSTVFINGEAVKVDVEPFPLMQQLADTGVLPPLQTGQVVELLCQWYNAGYLQFDT